MTMVPRGAAPTWLDVSRETLAKLDSLLSFVEKWNPAINLVAPGSLAEAWERHVLDSAQLFAMVPDHARTAADFGSGAGFPGLVVAIMAQASGRPMRSTLVESDKRKATFLRQAAQHLDLPLTVLTDRAEAMPPLNADVVSARALAPLTTLCGLAARHLAPAGVAIFPKGAHSDDELAEAQRHWRFDVQKHQSQTDSAGQILLLKDIHHV